MRDPRSCSRGHEYTPETLLSHHGYRRCGTCHAEDQRARTSRRREREIARRLVAKAADSGDEEWRAIPGFVGYEADTAGRIRSVDRYMEQLGSHGKPIRRFLFGSVLSPWIDPNGYQHVTIRDERHTVHSLVARAFLGRCPNGQEVRHRDGNATNSCASNLEYGTPSENCLDMVRHGTHHEARRHQCPRQHPLAPPNLLPAQLEREGKRSCLACNRAHSEARRLRAKGIFVDFQELADRKYAEVMATNGVPVVWGGKRKRDRP